MSRDEESPLGFRHSPKPAGISCIKIMVCACARHILRPFAEPV